MRLMTYDEVCEEAEIAFAEAHEFPSMATERDREDWIEMWIQENGPRLMGKQCPECGCIH